jgi:hypothetical protein
LPYHSANDDGVVFTVVVVVADVVPVQASQTVPLLVVADSPRLITSAKALLAVARAMRAYLTMMIEM